MVVNINELKSYLNNSFVNNKTEFCLTVSNLCTTIQQIATATQLCISFNNRANNVANDVENIHKMQCTQMTNELRNRQLCGKQTQYNAMHAQSRGMKETHKHKTMQTNRTKTETDTMCE